MGGQTQIPPKLRHARVQLLGQHCFNVTLESHAVKPEERIAVIVGCGLAALHHYTTATETKAEYLVQRS